MTVSASGIGSLLGHWEELKLSRFARTGDQKVLLAWADPRCYPLNYYMSNGAPNGGRISTEVASEDSSVTLRISSLWCGAALIGRGIGSRYRNGSTANL
jgi:hypothetical protein